MSGMAQFRGLNAVLASVRLLGVGPCCVRRPKTDWALARKKNSVRDTTARPHHRSQDRGRAEAYADKPLPAQQHQSESGHSRRWCGLDVFLSRPCGLLHWIEAQGE